MQFVWGHRHTSFEDVLSHRDHHQDLSCDHDDHGEVAQCRLEDTIDVREALSRLSALTLINFIAVSLNVVSRSVLSKMGTVATSIEYNFNQLHLQFMTIICVLCSDCCYCK